MIWQGEEAKTKKVLLTDRDQSEAIKLASSLSSMRLMSLLFVGGCYASATFLEPLFTGHRVKSPLSIV